ncbi:hypothetical protein E2C01_044450 [Portunus trituberculatus]|uniref:Uncharacterized protein n=1 Tax=Portunus trituberculatus TaxID=210409 RepID=A0A5B7FT69_PORTR|nr:hypothetical protein [Portunus trituberculatus]
MLMGKHKKLSGSREVADLTRETSSSGLSREEDSPPLHKCFPQQSPVLGVLLRNASLPVWTHF